MDEELRELLRQIIDLQKEQVDMMRKNLLPLWTRIRFSMVAVFVAMTLVAIALGIVAVVIDSAAPPATPPPQVMSMPPVDEPADDPFGPPTVE